MRHLHDQAEAARSYHHANCQLFLVFNLCVDIQIFDHSAKPVGHKRPVGDPVNRLPPFA